MMRNGKPNTNPRSLPTRSRTGCLTCKARRIKCGEERPGCNKCTRSGWQCDGYQHTRAINFTESTLATHIEPQYSGTLPKSVLRTPQIALNLTEQQQPASTAINKTGCVTCQVHHIVCDESIPAYPNQLREDWHHGGIPFANKHPITSLQTYSVSFRIPGTQSERQTFHYFCLQAAPDLSGYSSSNFWINLVLPSCHYEPAVRHAVLALSTFHREYVVEGSIGAQSGHISYHALRQYNKSIHQLQNYIVNNEVPPKKTILICCALFYCVEVALGDYNAALKNAKCGLAILKDWKKKQVKQSVSNMNSGPVEDIGDLVGVFSRIDVQLRIFENGQAPYLVLTSRDERSGLAPCVPAVFNSLTEVWAVMDKLINWVFLFLASNIETETVLPEHKQVEKIREKCVLEEELDRFSSTFNVFMEKHKKHLDTSNIDRDSAIMIAMMHRATNIFFHVSISDAGRISIDIESYFKEILLMAETMMASRGMEAKKQPRSFSFETGAVATLWVLAMNSQDVQVRAKALSILKSWPRREGLWDGQKVADAVEKALQHARSNPLSRRPTDVTKLKLSGSAESAADFHACLVKNPWRTEA